jgi:hypothetical protein
MTSRKPIKFHAIPSPTWDEFEHIHLSASAGSNGDIGGAVASIEQEVTIEQAREFARSILAACEIVEKDQNIIRTSEDNQGR